MEDTNADQPIGRGESAKVRSLVDSVYERLFRSVSRGEFPPGTKLPSENELAISFSVSRPVVRDALQRLRADGVIYSRRGSGSYVREVPSEQYLGFAPIETIADVQRCYEFREVIEPEAAFWAAQRRNEESLADIRQSLERLQRATIGNTHREDLDFEFHLAITRAANNHYCLSAVSALRDQIAVGMRLHGLSLLGPMGKLEHTFDEHAGIVTAIEARDGEGARRLMAEHLRNSRTRLFGGTGMDLSL